MCLVIKQVIAVAGCLGSNSPPLVLLCSQGGIWLKVQLKQAVNTHHCCCKCLSAINDVLISSEIANTVHIAVDLRKILDSREVTLKLARTIKGEERKPMIKKFSKTKNSHV